MQEMIRIFLERITEWWYNSSYAKIYNSTDLRTFGDNPATRRIALLYRSINTRNVRTASKLANARNTRVVTGIVVDIRVG